MCGRRSRTCIFVAVCSALLSSTASGQDYPNKPVRVLVGFPTGGVTDLVARVLGQKLSEQFGQQFLVDNRPGAGSVIASDITAKASPDGYTMSLLSTSFAINAGFYKKLPYDPLKDFTAIAMVSSAPQLLVSNAALPVKSLGELIQLARAKPGQLNFASSGTSSTSHLAGELLKSMAGINIAHVPYKGGASTMMPDVVSGRVQLSFLSLPGTLPHVKSGRVRPIAVTSLKRSSAAPDIPTFAESGLSGYEAASWGGFAGPARMSAAVVAKLNAETLRALRAPDVMDAMTRQGAEPLGSSPGEFDAYLRSEVAKWKKLIVGLGAQIEG